MPWHTLTKKTGTPTLVFRKYVIDAQGKLSPYRLTPEFREVLRDCGAFSVNPRNMPGTNNGNCYVIELLRGSESLFLREMRRFSHVRNIVMLPVP